MEQLSTCLLLLVFERPEQVSLTTGFADFVLFVKYKSRNVFFINNIFFFFSYHRQIQGSDPTVGR